MALAEGPITPYRSPQTLPGTFHWGGSLNSTWPIIRAQLKCGSNPVGRLAEPGPIPAYLPIGIAPAAATVCTCEMASIALMFLVRTEIAARLLGFHLMW